MTQEVSYDVRISVETFYHSREEKSEDTAYNFAYRITIENHCTHDIQLLRRMWYILDSHMELREVGGEGVVGQQPIIPSGSSYKYISGVDFLTEIGMMWGTYTMADLESSALFEVEVPEFTMMTPWLSN